MSGGENYLGKIFLFDSLKSKIVSNLVVKYIICKGVYSGKK